MTNKSFLFTLLHFFKTQNKKGSLLIQRKRAFTRHTVQRALLKVKISSNLSTNFVLAELFGVSHNANRSLSYEAIEKKEKKRKKLSAMISSSLLQTPKVLQGDSNFQYFGIYNFLTRTTMRHIVGEIVNLKYILISELVHVMPPPSLPWYYSWCHIVCVTLATIKFHS